MKNYLFFVLALSQFIFFFFSDMLYTSTTTGGTTGSSAGAGVGSLTYNVTLPVGLMKAELTLKSITQGGYTGKADLLGVGKNKGTFSTIPSGYYQVIFNLYKEDFTSAGKTESVYITKNETTALMADLSNVIFGSAPDPAQSYRITQSGPVSLDNLSANQIFAVAVNKAPGYVNYLNAGGVTSYTLNGTKYQVSLTGRSVTGEPFNTIDRDNAAVEQGDRVPLQYDKQKASEFNANPLPLPVISQNGRSAQNLSFTPPAVGDKRLFWLDDFDRTYTWQQKQATLVATSNHANVWVIDEYFDRNSTSTTDNKVNTIQAQEMAKKFDAIYQYTTPIFGYEYGGGPNSQQPGGVDGNPKIQILVYDIDSNGASGGTIGYFWSKDYYTSEYLQSQGSSYKSNLAEIFYIDSYFADAHQETVYSTLIHEFVHMINHNEKFVKYNKSYATWYTEMLAMLGEDIIGPLVGINPGSSGHPISMRIPYTLGLYSCDPFYWSGTKSYGVTFGYGAYLARNYGGAALVREIAQNDKTNIDSISAALSVFNPAVTFTQTVEKYHEAFICNDPWDRGMASFNRTVTSTIGGFRYTFYGFDIYEMNRVNVALSPGVIGYWSTTEKGPFLYGLTQNYYLDYYSFILLSCADWQNVNGNLIIDMKSPVSSSVNMYLVVR
jgi:hypothetical protein